MNYSQFTSITTRVHHYEILYNNVNCTVVEIILYSVRLTHLTYSKITYAYRPYARRFKHGSKNVRSSWGSALSIQHISMTERHIYGFVRRHLPHYTWVAYASRGKKKLQIERDRFVELCELRTRRRCPGCECTRVNANEDAPCVTTRKLVYMSPRCPKSSIVITPRRLPIRRHQIPRSCSSLANIHVYGRP